MCEKFNHLSIGDSLLIKGAKVSEFGGKSLNVSNDESMIVNSDHEQAHFIADWYRKNT
jgi:hypothetical protein